MIAAAHRRTSLSALVILATSALLLGLPAQAQETPPAALEAARHAIEQGYQQYIAGFAETDAGKVAAVYDSLGARLSDGGRVEQGRAAITAGLSRFFNRVGPVTVTVEVADLWLVDDLVYETGTWSYTYTPPGEAEKTAGGRYVTVWRKQSDGGWKMLADMGVPGT